jgi:hypothetical protein
MSGPLSPCPFCGNEYPNIVRWDESGEPRWRVVCLNCLHSNVFSEPEAIAAWNRAVRAVAPAGASEPRGEPSDAQMRAALGAWPTDVALPSEEELAAIVRAVNRAPWPDFLVAAPRDTPTGGPPAP